MCMCIKCMCVYVYQGYVCVCMSRVCVCMCIKGVCGHVCVYVYQGVCGHVCACAPWPPRILVRAIWANKRVQRVCGYVRVKGVVVKGMYIYVHVCKRNACVYVCM